MSALFRFSVSINKLKYKEIAKLSKEFTEGFSLSVDSNKEEYSFNFTEEMSLSSEQYHRECIVNQVWGRLKRYVPIEISVACLEYIPTEDHNYSKKEFNYTVPLETRKKWVKRKKK